MSLEALLAPFKFVDEQVLHQYTRLTLWWERKGHSRYSLALAAGGAGFLLAYGLIHNPWETGHPHHNSSIPPAAQTIWKTIGKVYGVIIGMDVTDSLRSMKHRKKEDVVSDVRVSDPDLIDRALNYARPVRLPILGFAALNLYVLGRYVLGGDINANVSCTLAGSVLLFAGPASSMYIKDTNQKILDRAPFWKRAYDFARAQIGKLKEKVKEKLTPEPELIPVPIEFYSSM